MPPASVDECLASRYGASELLSQPEVAMGQLIVRNLDDAVLGALKARAKSHGRSAEAEHRAILRDALISEVPTEAGDWFERARALSVRLSGGAWSTTDMLRADRDRDRVPSADDAAGLEA